MFVLFFLHFLPILGIFKSFWINNVIVIYFLKKLQERNLVSIKIQAITINFTVHTLYRSRLFKLYDIYRNSTDGSEILPLAVRVYFAAHDISIFEPDRFYQSISPINTSNLIAHPLYNPATLVSKFDYKTFIQFSSFSKNILIIQKIY